MLKFTVKENDGGQRLDKFLQKALKGIPLSLMYKYIRKKRIKVNSKRAKENQILVKGDIIELYIPDEFSKAEADTSEYDKVRLKPDVVFEDENLIICEKKAGMLSHTGDKGENDAHSIPERDTLIFIIRAYLYNKGEYDPNNESSFAPALANRLDRNTGGLVIAAKNAAALREVNRLIKDGCVDKRYLCAIHGRIAPQNGTLRGFLFKNSKTKTVTVYDSQRQGAKEIITSYKTEKYSKEHDLSLLEVHLETGRTHQIRAHFASVGHPLLGEGKYAHNKSDRELGYKYQALYSYKLTFNVPDGPLSYLDKKTVEADRKNIGFLTLF
ncbi:MAG: RluA family pseudouridine synthase [Ruminococcaceae bacterium]|nr:RluA family pseudouridine synthase [Oscillospiraceae bacterium]